MVLAVSQAGFQTGAPSRRCLSTILPLILGLNDIPTARAEGVSAVVDHKIYLIGERVRATDDARLFNDHIDSVRNEVFDPTTERWQARADAPTARNVQRRLSLMKRSM